jgi:hypothetical protein
VPELLFAPSWRGEIVNAMSLLELRIQQKKENVPVRVQ